MITNSLILIKNSIRNYSNFNKSKIIYSNKSDVIKNLKKKDYEEIYKRFKSYGTFINFCIKENIVIDSKIRRDYMYYSINKN